MLFFVVQLTSIIVILIPRLIMYLVAKLLIKVFKAKEDSIKFYLPISICFLLMYFQGFIGAVQGVSKVSGNNGLSTLEWYLIYTFLGVVSILWSYFKWDLKILSLPRLNYNAKEVALKKLLVFLGVFIFSLYFGYSQIQKTFDKIEVDFLLVVTNVTIVSGIIALDRVLNQVVILSKKE